MAVARSLVGAAVILAFIGTGTSASGEAPIDVRVDYVVLDTCPRLESFASQMKARAPQLRVVSDEPARAVKVRIGSHGARFSGQIAIADPSGRESIRSVEGASCAEVVTALALIGAFIIDPLSYAQADNGNAADVDPAKSGDATAKAGSEGTASSSKKQNPEPKTPKDPTATSVTNEESSVERTHDEPTNGAPAHWQFSFGAEAEVITGIAPVTLGSVPLFVELALESRDRVLSPSARVRFERPGTDADATAQGGAHFTWTEVGIDVCPISFWIGGSWRLQPCARAEIGAVEASGVETPAAREETRPWATVGAVATSRWKILGPLFAEIEAAAVVPLVRDRFYLDPQNATIFRANAIGGSAACGAGISIW